MLVYNRGKALLANGGLNLASDDIRVLLVGASYAADADHNFVNQITDELAGTGYVRKALTGESVTEDDANDRAFFDADDVVWTAINATPAVKAIVVFKFVSTDANSPLITYIDLTTAITTNGGDFTWQWNVGGILRLT